MNKPLKKFKMEYKLGEFKVDSYTDEELIFIINNSQYLVNNKFRIADVIIDIFEWKKNDIKFLIKIKESSIYKSLDNKSYLKSLIHSRVVKLAKNYNINPNKNDILIG
jgi:hypothetical protein